MSTLTKRSYYRSNEFGQKLSANIDQTQGKTHRAKESNKSADLNALIEAEEEVRCVTRPGTLPKRTAYSNGR